MEQRLYEGWKATCGCLVWLRLRKRVLRGKCRLKIGFRRHFRFIQSKQKKAVIFCSLPIHTSVLERCGYTEAVLVKLLAVCFGFGSIRDKLGRLADCAVAVVWVKLYAETADQLFAHIQIGADEPAFGV